MQAGRESNYAHAQYAVPDNSCRAGPALTTSRGVPIIHTHLSNCRLRRSTVFVKFCLCQKLHSEGSGGTYREVLTSVREPNRTVPSIMSQHQKTIVFTVICLFLSLIGFLSFNCQYNYLFAQNISVSIVLYIGSEAIFKHSSTQLRCDATNDT